MTSGLVGPRREQWSLATAGRHEALKAYRVQPSLPELGAELNLRKEWTLSCSVVILKRNIDLKAS